MNALPDLQAFDVRLRAALHPLDATLPRPGWNHAELADLIDAAVDASHVDAAVLVGLVRRDHGVQVVLTRRTDRLRHHAGQVSFPGGRVEPDDANVVAAALREAAEEIGLHGTQVTPLGLLDPLDTITGFRVVPVVAWIHSAFIATPDPGEVAEVFEVPLQTLLDPTQLMARPIDYKGRTRQVLEYRHRPQRIWGASASILLNLRHRLEALP